MFCVEEATHVDNIADSCTFTVALQRVGLHMTFKMLNNSVVST